MPSSINLDDLDRRILAMIQTRFPVAQAPYDVLSAELGLPANEILERVQRMREHGIIRRLGAVFDSRRLGYVSTLVAAKVSAADVQAMAEAVNRLPGVTHNYQRDHAWNLWFTMTAPSEDDLKKAILELRRQTGVNVIHSLPALAVYKRQAVFDADEPAAASDATPADGSTAALDEAGKELVRQLQEDIPLTWEPFAAIAAQLGRPEADVIRQTQDWLAAGVIRRFGAVAAHRELGYAANGMAVFEVPDDRADAFGAALARRAGVTHCYRRATMPGWPYNLFAMVHGRTPEEVRRLVAAAAREAGAGNYDILFSIHEFKKRSMRYFAE
jgi:DNA-binding Lrp family transcriptional regulator